jgi:hypothetical protein
VSYENVTKLRLTALAEVVAVLGARHRRSDRKFAGIYDSAAKSILAEAGNSNGKIVGVEQFLQLTTMGATGAYVAAPPPAPSRETPTRANDRLEQETQRDLWLQTVMSITQCFAPQIIETLSGGWQRDFQERCVRSPHFSQLDVQQQAIRSSTTRDWRQE